MSANSVLVLFGVAACLLGAVLISLAQPVEKQAAAARAQSLEQSLKFSLRQASN